MAILYLHGIGVRAGRHGIRVTARRTALLRRYLGPLVRADGMTIIAQPSWGDLGARHVPFAETPRRPFETLGETESDGYECFGLPEIADALGETLARWRNAPARALTQPALNLAIRCLRRPLTAAAGDLLLWLDQRRLGHHGPILAKVSDAIGQLASADREPLLLIGHSLGGVLLAESLAHRPVHHPALVLVTVGCPLALFSTLGIVSGPPAGLARWLNVFDPADPLAFAAHGVWPLAEDWQYRTGALFWAHGGYLARPSFYRRLAARLGEGPPWR